MSAEFPALDSIVDIAARAGQRVMEFYGDCGTVTNKACGSPVTAADRAAHQLIVGELAARWPAIPVISEEGVTPEYVERRDWDRFWLVDPLDECERRDIKGLYARARRGDITGFTGIDDPYEPPEDADLTIDTSKVALEESVTRVVSFFRTAATAVDMLPERSHER